MTDFKAQAREQRRSEKWQERQERSRDNRDEVHKLKQRLKDLSGKLDHETDDGYSLKPEPLKFADLPISSRTMQGLERGNYSHLTRIQSSALPAALCGRDILGAAKTGSGKTLTFLIPVLERLWLEQWSSDAGVGAMILSPTRELALQTFKVLQVVGIRHTLSAALLTGGRNVEEEKSRLHAINVVVGTPGRVLHHLTETSGLSCENLLMLIFDEADRLLDMGFRDTITSILDQLPQEDENRQTLLFSATQTRDVQLLGQLCTRSRFQQQQKKKKQQEEEEERKKKKNKKNNTTEDGEEEEEEDENNNEKKQQVNHMGEGPLFITDHPTTQMSLTASPTPTKMCQNFIVVELQHKLDLLYLFLRRHSNDKIVVFASTQNQIRFMFLAFSKLLKKTKIPAMCLTGKMKQFRREEVFMTFCRCKSAVLFCTDLAARGLDFPMVHWVVQFDCPESPQTYVHRAGRTARAGARGVNLLFLTPTELPMLSYLHQKQIPMREITVKDHMWLDTTQMFVALAVQGLKLDAQKACVGYLRSLHFAANKNVFKLDEVDCEAFARSLGLNAVPDLAGVTTGRSAKNLPWDVQNFIAAVNKKKTQQQQQSQSSSAASGGGSKAIKGNNNNNNSKLLLGDDDDEDDEEPFQVVADDGEEEEDFDEEGESDDDEVGGKKKKKENLTRRERHLAASDMFTSLEAAQRFNVKKDNFFESESLQVKKNKQQQQPVPHHQQKKKFADSSDDDDDQGDAVQGGEEELFKKRRVQTAVTASASGTRKNNNNVKEDDDGIEKLTAEDRLRGLSKHKQRKIVKSADLKVKDLHLNTRIKFADDDDDEDDDDQEETDFAQRKRNSNSSDQQEQEQNEKKKQKKKKQKYLVDNMEILQSDDDDNDDNNNLEDDENIVQDSQVGKRSREKYITELQSRVKSATLEDKQRARERKFKILEKKGLRAPRGGEEGEGGANAADDDEYYSSSDEELTSDDDEEEGGGKRMTKRERDLDELLRAARGELYSSDDEEDEDDGDADDDHDLNRELPIGDEDEDEQEEEEEQPKKFTGRHKHQQQQQQQQQQGGKRMKPATAAASSSSSGKSTKRRRVE